MTDNKPIIIDGIDVSECIFYQANFEEDFDVKIKHFCSNWHNSCESVNNSNCYFKQLARKTHEVEELKKQLTSLSYADTICALEIDLKHKTQECERLKRYLNEIRNQELFDLDIDWDEYETQCTSTEYSNIINLVEEALGEREDGRI